MLPPFHSKADSECVWQEDKEWPEGSDMPLKFGAVFQSKIFKNILINKIDHNLLPHITSLNISEYKLQLDVRW